MSMGLEEQEVLGDSAPVFAELVRPRLHAEPLLDRCYPLVACEPTDRDCYDEPRASRQTHADIDQCNADVARIARKTILYPVKPRLTSRSCSQAA